MVRDESRSLAFCRSDRKSSTTVVTSIMKEFFIARSPVQKRRTVSFVIGLMEKLPIIASLMKRIPHHFDAAKSKLQASICVDSLLAVSTRVD